jgi:hypothetical protein
MTDTKHLWEVDHDYYGPDSNYFATGVQQRDYSNTFETFAAFFEDWGRTPGGLNWLYRFDWIKADLDDLRFFPDMDTRDTLRLFYLLPRKGILLDHTIYVTEDDEPAVRLFLEQHAEYTRRMWEPFLTAPLEGATQ